MVEFFGGINVTYDGVQITDKEAKQYYIKAYFFSQWVQNNLSDVEAGTMQQREFPAGITTPPEYKNFAGDTTRIFNITTNDNNPESEDSLFADHKRDVIKNSIQFNLNTAISTYTANYHGDTYDYSLPVMSTDDWDSILNNVCMVSFLQGMPCGLTKFNNYAVVKSNNNNTSVNVDNVYYTERIGETAEGTDYHKYDCPVLSTTTGVYQSDTSAEFKYDARRINVKVSESNQEDIICLYDDLENKYYEIAYNPNGVISIGPEISNITNYSGFYYNNNNGIWIQVGNVGNADLTRLPNGEDLVYIYDHRNLGCYTCIISGNYDPVVKYVNGELYKIYRTENYELILGHPTKTASGYTWNWTYEDGRAYTGGVPATDVISDDEYVRRKTAICTAIAKYRNNLYKNNDYINR